MAVLIEVEIFEGGFEEARGFADGLKVRGGPGGIERKFPRSWQRHALKQEGI